MATARIAAGIEPRAFFTYLEPSDIGLAVSAVLGVFPFVWTFAGAKIFASKRLT